jgi:hypothetical protein
MRTGLVAMALMLAAPLATAFALKPDPTGCGTHRQLGLPPCTFQLVLGIPCPSCGMTTSWAHALRGQMLAALRANVGGTLLCLGSLAAVPWLVACAWAGRWLPRAVRDQEIAWASLGLVTITLVDWAIRLVR